MIDLDVIKPQLSESLQDYELSCFEELPSTNRYLHELAKKRLVKSFCLTSKQTAGYGQRSRQWFSDHRSLTFSMLLPLSEAPANIDGITQLVALKLVESLSDYTEQRFSIKWPNDLYIDDRKVGGILLEIPAITEDQTWMIVGVGLNLHSDADKADYPSSAGPNPGMMEITDVNPFKIACLLSDIALNLESLFQGFHHGQFEHYLLNYQLVDYFQRGSKVIVYDNDQNSTGLYQGLNTNGEVQVMIDHSLKTYRSGSVSIRPVENV
ncbi:MAG: biotin--[acetyl-CoA-carboxylase] ligase [Thiomicrorhabdus chilensis]|uniref:biotin--[acetyl-CoA-carboxylase] ligase n=1 Tax=Thiomicrorhabdus chilensis TaxID=63656 RepID=UPI00299E1814|nr:biotin--[acetyl-CoA-carboxylase] ligase [Thiomicrorhabdus chilensis]MDX1347788.1 biotin--[acetyl-CoA-carboxylase] ligase [Thiomicrorhabdus chilensis]